MKKGEIYRGRVRELAFPNKGIASVDGVDVIIKNTLPGQEISFILNKNKPGLKEGRLLSVIERSKSETMSGCSVCGRECEADRGAVLDGKGDTASCMESGQKPPSRCGGCVYQTIPYEEELKIKDRMTRDILGRALKQHAEAIGGESHNTGSKAEAFLNGIYEGITGSPVMEGYRNKMEFSFGNAVKDGPLTLGMHVSGHFLDVLDTPDCNIVDEDFRTIREYVRTYCLDHGLPFYHRGSNSGYLRNLLIRKGMNTGEILVDIVTTSGMRQDDADDLGTGQDMDDSRGSYILDDDGFSGGLLSLELKGCIVGVLHTIHDGVADAVINESTSVIFGRDHIFDEILGLRFKISAFSFFQTNTPGAEVLYDRVREYVRYAVGKDMSSGVVYDLYSGTGTIAQLVSEAASFVYGVEIVPEAVEAAVVNAELNGIDNVHFVCGDVLKVLDDLENRPDLIILDPPRDGVNPKALRKILDYGVDNIVYVSCKITSLARDLHMMIDAGYQPRRISVIDMFPRTANMETVCLLSNRKPDARVKIDVDLEDYYRIKDEQKKNKASE